MNKSNTEKSKEGNRRNLFKKKTRNKIEQENQLLKEKLKRLRKEIKQLRKQNESLNQDFTEYENFLFRIYYSLQELQ